MTKTKEEFAAKRIFNLSLTTVFLVLLIIPLSLFCSDDPNRSEEPRSIRPILTRTDISVGPNETITSIQEAIDIASTTDVITVLPGVYAEDIEIDKPLKIRSTDLFETIIVGSGGSNIVEIGSENCVFSGFTIQGTIQKETSGILINSDLNEITDCYIINCTRSAIQVKSSSSNLIRNNVLRWNNVGIEMVNSKMNSIYSNHFKFNEEVGLVFDASSNGNTVYGNTFKDNNGSGAQAIDNGYNNTWNNSKNGNYWMGWQNPDKNSDGTIDVPYAVNGTAGAIDYLPIKGFDLIGSQFIEPIDDLAILGKEYRYNVTFIDGFPEFGSFSWNANDWPTWMNVDFVGSKCQFTGIPEKDDLGIHTFNLTVNDNLFTQTIPVRIVVVENTTEVQGFQETNETDEPEFDRLVLFIIGTGIVIITIFGFWFFFLTELGLFLLFSLIVSLPLFSRIKVEDTLNQQTRGMIYGYILANPGVRYTELMEELDVSNGVLVYHLKFLLRRAFIKDVKTGVHKKFYPIRYKGVDFNIMSPNQCLIASVIKKNNGLIQNDIAKETSLSQSTVSRNLPKIEEMGYIKSEIKNRKIVYYFKNRSG